MEEKTNAYGGFLWGKPEGRTPLLNTSIYLGVVWEGFDQDHMSQVRGKWSAVVTTVMNLRVPKMWGIV